MILYSVLFHLDIPDDFLDVLQRLGKALFTADRIPLSSLSTGSQICHKFKVNSYRGNGGTTVIGVQL